MTSDAQVVVAALRAPRAQRVVAALPLTSMRRSVRSSTAADLLDEPDRRAPAASTAAARQLGDGLAHRGLDHRAEVGLEVRPGLATMSAVPSSAEATLRSSSTLQSVPTPRLSQTNADAAARTARNVAGALAVLPVGEQDRVADRRRGAGEQLAGQPRARCRSRCRRRPAARRSPAAASARVRVVGDGAVPTSGYTCWAQWSPAIDRERDAVAQRLDGAAAVGLPGLGESARRPSTRSSRR